GAGPSSARAAWPSISGYHGILRDMTVKLYMHPVSTASRPVWLYCAENKLPVTNVIVDLMKGEHLQAEYTAINPSQQVPTLEDGEFRLTESSAILKYLAARFEQ